MGLKDLFGKREAQGSGSDETCTFCQERVCKCNSTCEHDDVWVNCTDCYWR